MTATMATRTMPPRALHPPLERLRPRGRAALVGRGHRRGHLRDVAGYNHPGPPDQPSEGPPSQESSEGSGNAGGEPDEPPPTDIELRYQATCEGLDELQRSCWDGRAGEPPDLANLEAAVRKAIIQFAYELSNSINIHRMEAFCYDCILEFARKVWNARDSMAARKLSTAKNISPNLDGAFSSGLDNKMEEPAKDQKPP